MIAFSSPAQAENGEEQNCPPDNSQSTAQYAQYQAPGCDGPSTQSIEERIKDAVEDSGEGGVAVEGAKSYIEEVSPEEAGAEEADAEGVE